ncbi:MAG: phosphatase PAP2 family protein [Pseudomonadota bacterium]
MAKHDEMTVLERIFATGDATMQRSLRPPRLAARAQGTWPPSVNFNAAVIVWIVCIILAFAGLDGPVAHWAKAHVAPDTPFHSFFDTLTRLGESLWFLLVTFIMFMTMATIRWPQVDRRERFRLSQVHGAAFFAFATVAVIGTAISIVKHTIGRARPSQLETLGPYHSAFPIWDATFASFPSGHSTTFGASAMALALIFPRYRWAFLVFGILGGTSRIVLGAHWISDVMAGLGIGALFVLLCARFLARRRTLFVFDGTVFPRLAATR